MSIKPLDKFAALEAAERLAKPAGGTSRDPRAK